MDEYIKRKDVVARLVSAFKLQAETATMIVESIPSANVAERKHGEWILEYEPNGKPYCFHCSVCDGDFHYIDITTAYPFCPHCGAEMEVDG